MSWVKLTISNMRGAAWLAEQLQRRAAEPGRARAKPRPKRAGRTFQSGDGKANRAGTALCWQAKSYLYPTKNDPRARPEKTGEPLRTQPATAAAAERSGQRTRGQGEIDMNLDMQSLLILIVVGIVAGWLAGVIVRGYGLGLVGNLVVGVIGAFLATWLLPKLGVAFSVGNPLVTSIVYATIGAVVLLLLVGLVRRGR